MANTSDNERDTPKDETTDEAWQKLTPAADTTMNANAKTGNAERSTSVREHSPQNATGGPVRDEPRGHLVGGAAGRGGVADTAPTRAGDTAISNNLPHGMSADIPDDAVGGTMAQGAATPGTASRDRRDREPNPDATDTAIADEGRQRIRNP